MLVLLGAVHMFAFVAVFVSIAREVDFVHLDWRVECDCCRLQAMRHKIGMLLMSFSMCTHDTADYMIWHNLSGVDNDDFMAILVKRITCLLKCYNQCFGVCEKPLLNAWNRVMMLENGILPRMHACLKFRDDPTAHSVKTHSSLRLRVASSALYSVARVFGIIQLLRKDFAFWQ